MPQSPINILITQAQRIVIAELLPALAERFKLAEKNSRTISFTSEVLNKIQQTAETARHRSDNGMKRHSLGHVVDAITKALKDAEGVGSIPATVRLYQFKITLLEITPPIWRRIQVRNCSLDKLHEAVEQITAIRNELLSPPLLVSLSAKPVEQCGPNDPLGLSVKKMHDGVFSQLPIYDGQKCLGLLTAETIARWLALHLGDGMGLVEEKPIADVMRHQEDHDNHTFLARTATVADGLSAFDDYLSRGKRLEAILITQNGRSSEALLGIITVHDIPKLNQAIHR